MRNTPWAHPTSSLTSDRLRPPKPPARASSPSNTGKGKGKGKEPATPKSPEVTRLETLISAVRDASGNEKDPKGGCFCQARKHPLSQYTPLCFTCALPLCSLNLPHHACPSCNKPLLTPASRAVLVERLDTQLAETLQKEAKEAERLVEEARRAAGAFPTLGAAASASNSSASSLTPSHGSSARTLINSVPTTPQGHKVMSLTSTGKGSKKMKVTMRTAYTPSPSTSTPNSGTSTPAPEPEPEPDDRVPAPPRETPFVKAPPPNSAAGYEFAGRPFMNLARPMTYVPPPRLDDEEEDPSGSGPKTGGGRKRRKKKGEAKENSNVPGAAP